MPAHRGEINSIEQPEQLLRREFGHRALFNRPDEARVLEALLQQPEPVAIPTQYLDAVLPSVAEHKHGVRKCVQPKPMFDQACQPVDVLAEIDGVAMQEHHSATIPGFKQPRQAIVFTRDGKTAYVLNEDLSVSKVDRSTQQIVATIAATK